MQPALLMLQDVELAYVKLIQRLSIFRGHKETFAALKVAEGKFIGFTKSRIQILKLQLLHDHALHQRQLKLAQRVCDELGALASSVSGVDLEVKTEACLCHARTLLAANQFSQGSEWDFGVFSGLEGVEKPDPRIYQIALERAENIAPGEVLHIGDSVRKDCMPAKALGMHALLLDRFKTREAESWRQTGAPVLPDLVTAQAWLTAENINDGTSSSSSQDGQISSSSL